VATVYEVINGFLGLNADSSLISDVLSAGELVEWLDKEQIEAVLPDREPFLILKKAVIFKDKKGRLSGVTLSEISEKECDGHLKLKLMAPLIMFSRALALTGRLLCASISDRGKSIPEVLETGKVKSLIPSLLDMKYTVPPVKVLSFARVKRQIWLELLGLFSKRLRKKLKRLIVLDSQCWIVADNKFIPAGSIKRLKYYLIPAKLLYAALEGPLSKKPA